MKKKIIIGSIILILIIGIAIALFIFMTKESTFKIETKSSNEVVVTTKNASKESGGVGYITLEEGQKIVVEANLEDKSTLKVEILPEKFDKNTKALKEKDFTKTDKEEYELAAGAYAISVTSQNKATGNLNIQAK